MIRFGLPTQTGNAGKFLTTNGTIASWATGALNYKGAIDASSNPNYPAALSGDVYVVSVDGKVGGASGVVVEAGDLVLAKDDNAGGTQAAVGSHWDVIQFNISILPVTKGGTGVGTLAAHGVLVGEGTSPVVAVTAMSNGQLLVGQTAADPMGVTVSGDINIDQNGVVSSAASFKECHHYGNVPVGATNFFTCNQLSSVEVPLFVARVASKITELYIVTETGNGAAHTDVYTVRVNNVNTAFTVSIVNGTTGTSAATAVALSPGDKVSLKLVSDAATVAANVTAEISLTKS